MKSWERDYDWVVIPSGYLLKRCRMIAGRPPVHCPNRAIAMFLRRDRRRGKTLWAYCGDHLYGRRIANGYVEFGVETEVIPP